MTSPAPKRPFWKRKRWIAAAVLWLVIAYPLSMGPVAYGVAAGHISPAIAEAGYGWLVLTCNAIGPAAEPFADYVRWCYDAGASL